MKNTFEPSSIKKKVHLKTLWDSTLLLNPGGDKFHLDSHHMNKPIEKKRSGEPWRSATAWAAAQVGKDNQTISK